MAGWICLHRKIIEWEWYSDLNTRAFFFHLLLSVNYENKKWHGEIINRGELISSREHLAKDCGLTVKQIRLAEQKLTSTKNLTIKTTNKFTKYTIVNYEKYQSKDEIEGNQRANGGQTEGNQRATTKQENNITKEQSNPLPPWLPIIEWEAFKEMRNKIRKPMTATAEKIAIKKLENFQFEGKNVQEILNYSILNNYQGIFEPKAQGELYGKQKQSPIDIAAEAIQRGRAAYERSRENLS